MFSFLSDLFRWFGQGLLTRPSSATACLPVSHRWRVTCRPPVGRTAIVRSALPRWIVGVHRRCRAPSSVSMACEAGAVNCLEKSEKRGVHAARNGPGPPPTPAGGPVARPEMSTADRHGSRERAAGATHFVAPINETALTAPAGRDSTHEHLTG